MVRSVPLVLLAAIVLATAVLPRVPTDNADELNYTGDQMNRPDNYREWIWLSSGIGMSYSPHAQESDNPGFDNVFASPSAFKVFQKTGRWPDRTVLVLEGRRSVNKGSINQAGRFQGEQVGLEVHVKDERRFKGGWAFFSFDNGGRTAKVIPQSADCYSCHEKSGAVDTTFVQFYPTLLAIAQQKKTVRPSY